MSEIEPPPALGPSDPGYIPIMDDIVDRSMGRPMWYDRRCNPISMRQWVALNENDSYKRVALTKVTEDVEVSTVWLGLDHNFLHMGPPLIFETMVFTKLDKPVKLKWFDGQEMLWEGGEMLRYSTEQQAIEGHTALCQSLFVPDSPEATDRSDTR